MCGVSSIVSKKILLEDSISKMVQSQFHRGPDASDTYINSNHGVALGHNRLAIVDLSDNGIQPMSDIDNDFVISYNGEIYNFLDLKSKLIKKGYQFKSNTDTEVILYGYKEWGSDVFLMLDGMWAIIIFDKVKNKLIASRDRFGIKPIYYYHSNETLIMSSEVKAILRTEVVKADVSIEGLDEYFSFQNIISKNTLFKDIFMLLPGHNLEYDLDSYNLTFNQYWDLNYNQVDNFNEEEFCEKIKSTFSEVCKSTLLGDVPIGVTISGGMDSSSIIAATSKHREGLNTFTGYFDHSNLSDDERSFNELNDARLISEQFKTDHHERKIYASDVITTLPAIVWHLEDPKVGMCYTFYAINQLVSQYVTVNLSGTGGDEIFGGYPWRYKNIENSDSYADFCKKYYNYWTRLIKDDEKKNFFTEDVLKKIPHNNSWNSFLKVTENRKNESALNLAMYFEAKTFLHGMLMVEDKMGMAFSIETRFPFLTNKMVELTSYIPDHYKYDNQQAKILLKKAYSKILPKEIINKKKQGFTPPDMTWYRGELRDYIQQLLLGRDALITKYINRDYIEQTLKQHENSDCRLKIWSFLFFEGWLKTFIKSEGQQIKQF